MAGKSTIKGLTIEIGGDTTKLGKALENVNKKSQDLSSELGDINSLLKWDPGNVDLLAQKQKVLADAVENTKQKLDTLKEAEQQVQKQFERGEVSEAQVRELRREIIATEKKLGGYEKAIEETNDALKGHVDSSEKAEKSAGDLGRTVANVAKAGFTAVTAAVTAAVTGLVAAAESTREYRTEMGKLDTAFTTAGHSSATALETYQALQGVLGESDQAVEAANHLAQLANNEEDLAKWTNIATGVFATFGASLPVENIAEAANETAKTGAIVGGLADALNWAGVSEEDFQAKLDACTTEQERQALITETLNGLYGEAANAYRETNAEVIRANEANEAWMATMAQAGAAVEPILTDIKMLGVSLLEDFMPSITGLTDAFHGLINGADGAAEELGTALSNIVTELLGKVVELAPTLGKVAMELITTLVDSLVDMVPLVLDAAIDLLLTIVEAIPTVITALVKALPQIITTIVQTLMSRLPDIIRAAVNLLMGIIQAIPTIQKELIKQMPTIIKSIVNGLVAGVKELVKVGGDLLAGLLKGMLDPGAIWSAVKSIFGTVMDAFKSLFGVHSPSRVIRDQIGKQLSAGLAEGITANADEPIDAMQALTDDLLGDNELNGLTLDRKLQATFGGAPANAASTGLLSKLDSILAAIERGQVLMIDKDTLVGSTLTSYDSKLGQRRALAVRGAL